MRANQLIRIPAAALAVALMAALAAPAALARDDVRFRIEVDDPQTGEQRVRLNVPLGSIESVLEIVGEELDHDLRWDRGPGGIDMRAFYHALRDEDLSDFLEVNGKDGEHVKIWKDRDAFHLQVQEEGYYEPNVRVYLPLQVLDVLFQDEERMDLRGAVEELRRLAPLTLVEVDKEDETVRVYLE